MLLQNANADVKNKLRSLKDCHGLTPAHIATSKGMADTLEVLIEHDCVNYTICDDEKQSVMITAWKEKDVVCTHLLLKHFPANVDISKIKDASGNNLLHIACQLGETEIIPDLIKSGISVSETNSVNITPFGCAIAYNQSKACALLIPLVFRPDDLPVKKGDPRLVEIHMAAMFGRNVVLKHLIDRKVNLSVPDEFESTTLHLAASHGHIDTIKLLLDADVNPRLLNKKGYSASAIAEFVGYIQIAELLKAAESKYRNNQEGYAYFFFFFDRSIIICVFLVYIAQYIYYG